MSIGDLFKKKSPFGDMDNDGITDAFDSDVDGDGILDSLGEFLSDLF
jgi:hypothetical protein